MAIRIGIDTGGTFTDFVVSDGSGFRVHKVRSTPHDPSEAILQGLREMGVDSAGDREIVHGSTVATNALLERKGAHVALVTTEGFEDILLIGRQTRRELYNFFVEQPAPIVRAERTIGLPERVLFDGTVARPLDKASLDRLVTWLHEVGVDAVSVCLLHAYANPIHEQAITTRLVAEGFSVSASHEILSEYREFERCSTTTVNAYVTPMMASYVVRLEKALNGDPLRIMQSNGGTSSAASTRRRPVHTVLSGPAGGVVGAAAVAEAAGFTRIITFDMGGTSTDVSLVDRVPTRTAESVVGDFPIRLPMLDIHTVGAGGGSIAYLDSGGSLRVGPESAGADPGPACYGQGEQVTVTDANLLLGRIDPGRFLGGRMRICPDRARAALVAFASRAHLDVMTLAEGIIRVANARMERAIRVVSVERGFDPRDFTLVPFGGAGGLHACDIARTLDIRSILVPANPGVLSALGMLLSDVICDVSHSLLMNTTALALDILEREFGALSRLAHARLNQDGFEDSSIRLERTIDVRYVGQAYEINVPFVELPSRQPDGTRAFVTAFHAAHERMYGYADRQRPVEIVNVRVRGIGLNREPGLLSHQPKHSARAPEPVSTCYLFADGEPRPAAIYDRAALQPGQFFCGPSLAVDEGSTTFVPDRWQASIDGFRNLVLTRRPL
jgi:N-methylhydantoinase A/oxoprolinase/acetone carboxylase beta subunit